MTQLDFGKQIIHVSQATASKKLNGQIPFSAEEIFECAERFNVSTEYLYERELRETEKPANTVNRGDSYGSHSPRRPRNV